MDHTSTSDTDYQRLVAEYRDTTIRCMASLDQLRAAERELNALEPGGIEAWRESQKIARQMFPLLAPVDEAKSLDVGKLSDREYEVFVLIGDGLGTRQIAEQLGLTLSTVETYRERVKSKLGLENGNALTRQATIWALSKRLSDGDS
jgi:DNA-binding NarL/FixJ family response regulator